ncbi:MAG: thiamine biosynthesis protein ApbE [Betaproteobacteria bacterium HGW-Betaproteobacteria-1]|nr:MAG: thiamine biosynthesis protein ApbE [Betaproteobacteria bacterium HGW-Betaproteobacteria-1]
MQRPINLWSLCTKIRWNNLFSHREHRVHRENPPPFLKNRISLWSLWSLWSLCALWLTVLALSSCGREPLYQSQSYVFGTLVDISIYGEEASRAADLAAVIQQDFQRLHHKLHAWNEDSDLSRLNRAFAAGERVAIDPELAQLIRHAQQFSAQSDGLFNPAIGLLIGHWGFQRDMFKPVDIDRAAIEELVVANPQMGDIVLLESAAGIEAEIRNPAVKLDFGGYAKGYALDRAAAYLKAQGANNALINIGGNVIALGRRGERNWHVGIQHPRKPGAIASLDLEDGWAIGTSGDYQRYFELDGKRYCHVLDPRNGFPAQHTQSITVLLPPGELSGTLSDVASKPIFISNDGQRSDMAKKLGVENFMVIDDAGNIAASPAMQQRLKWKNDVEVRTLP